MERTVRSRFFLKIAELIYESPRSTHPVLPQMMRPGPAAGIGRTSYFSAPGPAGARCSQKRARGGRSLLPAGACVPELTRGTQHQIKVWEVQRQPRQRFD